MTPQNKQAFSIRDFVIELKSKKKYERKFTHANVVLKLQEFEQIDMLKLSNAYVVITNKKTTQKFRDFYLASHNNKKSVRKPKI